MAERTGAGGAPGEQEQRDRRDFGGTVDRIWEEIKDVFRQVESETRRGGRIARLTLDLRHLRRELGEVTSRLGQRIYESQREMDRRPAMAQVEGYDELIERIDDLHGRIGDKEAELERLKQSDDRAA